jgi:hypothetical protein
VDWEIIKKGKRINEKGKEEKRKRGKEEKRKNKNNKYKFTIKNINRL